MQSDPRLSAIDHRPSTPSPTTPWQTLVPGFSLDDATLAEILDGGQAFRWKAHPADASWIGAWDGCVAHLRRSPANPAGSGVTPPQTSKSSHACAPSPLQWRAPLPLAAHAPDRIGVYFAVHRDWAALTDALPWRSDPHLARCIAAFPNLRILRQPFGETLLGFLCSATKQIVQIKQMMALLAERHGAELLPGHHRLPTWPELARVPETELRQCLLGFRARYIHQTAQFLAAHPGWLEEVEAAPYPIAKDRLCSLPGVGEKVADCVLLFGAGRLEAFPVDVWVLRALSDRYGLQGWKPAQIAQFGRIHFGPHAGLAQQFLFAFERRFRIKREELSAKTQRREVRNNEAAPSPTTLPDRP